MSQDDFSLVAMGRIVNPAGVPAWAGSHPGFAAAITDNGVGDYTVTLDGGGQDATESATIVSIAEAQAANLQITKAVTAPTDATRRITIVQETGGGGGATAAYDGAVDIVVVSARQDAQHDRIRCIAVGTIEFAVAGTPSWLAQQGFQPAITDGGVGDSTVTLDGGGVDALESAILIQCGETQAASLAIEFGAVHLTDTTKQITCTQEQAAGGASIRYDGVYHIAVFRACPP